MRWWFLIAVLLNSCFGSTNERSVNQQVLVFSPGFYPLPFAGELEAVIMAANNYNPTSIKEDREFIGGIFADNTKSLFYYSAKAGQIGANQITATLTYPSHLTLVAIWHTHGKGEGFRHLFSEQDFKLAKQLQVPIYLADSSGFLKKYSPNSTGFLVCRQNKITSRSCNAKKYYLENSEGDRVKINTDSSSR